ncbi:MAG TPA: hypothetical protein V6C89_14940 [Drouetiella sp.]|jgi:hypothetical protein
MLRLFRNFLSLATVLYFGAAAQAQQQPAKAAAPAASASAKSTSVPAAKATGPAPVSQIRGASTSKATSPVPIKSAKTDPVHAITVAPAASANKTNAAATKPVRLDPATTGKASKSDPASAAKATKADLSAKTKTTVKAGEKSAPARHTPEPRLGLVPPPPPDTPTMFAGDGIFPGFGMPDFNNPAALAGRRKDIASQLASAKKLLVDKEQRTKELKEKATQFEQLFSEGVISRRELESAQKDAVSAAAELNDARTQTVAYQNAMSRLDDRLKGKPVASKKTVKGKTKPAPKSGAKVSSAVGQVDNPASAGSASATPKSDATVKPDAPKSDATVKPAAPTDLKATPGP